MSEVVSSEFSATTRGAAGTQASAVTMPGWEGQALKDSGDTVTGETPESRGKDGETGDSTSCSGGSVPVGRAKVWPAEASGSGVVAETEAMFSSSTGEDKRAEARTASVVVAVEERIRPQT